MASREPLENHLATHPGPGAAVSPAEKREGAGLELGGRLSRPASSLHAEPRLRYSELRKELIDVERTALVDLRNRGHLRPDSLRVIERDLDLEEARLGAG